MRQILLQSLIQLGRQLGLALWLLVLVPAALLLAANTDLGQRMLTWGLQGLTGGQVVPQGLGGTLPWAPRLQRLELRDQDGTWLVIEGASLGLAPWPLLRGVIAIGSLSARTLTLYRLPKPSGDNPTSLRLPLRIRLDHLAIGDLRLAPAFPGAPPLVVEGQAASGGSGPLEVRLAIQAPGRPDRYRLDLKTTPEVNHLAMTVQESPGGLLPALAGSLGWSLPARLQDWRLEALAAGPASALALRASLEAGSLKAATEGVIDLGARSATGLRLEAQVPQMTLALADGRSLNWAGLAVTADLSGPWDAPQGVARIEAEGLMSGGLALERLHLTAWGDPRVLHLEGELRGLRTSQELPESARRVPLRVTGTMALADQARPFTLALDHPLLALTAGGRLRTASARARLRLPDLAPLAKLADLPLAGSAELDLVGTLERGPRLAATGKVELTQAPSPLRRLLGPQVSVDLAARRDGGDWLIDTLEIDGAGLELGAQGAVGSDRLALGWTLDLANLHPLSPGWTGRIQAQGEFVGPLRTPDLTVDLSAQGAHEHLGPGRLQGQLRARLAAPAATLRLTGDLTGQPLTLSLNAGRAASGDLEIGPAEGRWASLGATGDLVLTPGSTLPQGELRLEVERLADLAPWIAAFTGATAPELDGRLRGRLELAGDAARIEAQGDGLTLPRSVRIQALVLDTRLLDPLGTADTKGRLQLTGLSSGTIGGDLTLAASGPLRDLGLTAGAELTTGVGPAHLALDGRLDVAARRLGLQRLEAQAADQSLRLLSPALLELSEGLAVDRLRLGLGTGSLEIGGRLVPALDLAVRLARLPLEPLALVAPDLPLTGTLDGEARLTGAPDSPTGPVRLQAQGVRLTRGPGRGLAPAEVDLRAQLGPTGIQLDASARAGPDSRLGLRGILGHEALDLKAEGRIDLALLDPLLTALGRQAAGQAALDTRITGSPGAPRLDGSLRLTDGAIWDRTLGLVLTQVNGRLVLAGEVLQIEGLSGRAGPGSLSMAGSIGVLSPGIPVDLRLVARDASPLQRDLLKIQGDGDLRLTGQGLGRLDMAGAVRLSRAEIRLPERLPANVVTLEVREVGQRRSSGPRVRTGTPWRPDLGLDLLLSAPRGVYVQGRGVDAELGGEVRLQGTLAEPQVTGGFDLRRGEYDLVGQTLRFSRGRLGFEGAAGLDPSLDLEARVTAAGSTAILAVQGTAQAPRIELRGEPEMPQDEVLSRLLFGVAGGRLSPWQATRLGLAAASLAGLEVEGPGLLERVRQGLGLGRLSGGANAQGGTILGSGRQLSERVYLGTRQGTRAGEPQGVLRIEATPRIQLEADVGPIGGTRAGAAFEIEY